MHRLLAIFLLVFLPLQAVWAAAAPYCGHEETVQATHVGHHAHDHEDSQLDLDDGGLTGDHADCDACQGGANAMVSLPQVAPPSAARTHARALHGALPAAPPSIPDRPDWARLA